MREKLPVANRICGLILLTAFSFPAVVAAETGAPSNFQSMINASKVYLSNRYRYEWVDQDGLANTAKASTLRNRLGVTSGELSGLSAKIEIENVQEIGSDSFNNTLNGKTDYPVVADVEGTEVNQAFLQFTGLEKTVLRGGRENLVLDNHRFIGDVGWRQNNQTYDGVNIVNQSLENTKLFYGFVGNVNRIFGEDSSVGDYNTQLHLFNVNYSGINDAALVGYAYLLDVDNAPAASSSNIGSSLTGKVVLDTASSLLYEAELAYQQDYQNNPLDYSALYWRLGGGYALNSLSLLAGYESLGSDGGNVGFSTPFATLHKWNGWADKFLSTPETGLDDVYGGLRYTWNEVCPEIRTVAFETYYHYFSAEEGGDKYGTEWDFNLMASASQYFSFGLKYASYNSSGFASDTDKLIFSLESNFSEL